MSKPTKRAIRNAARTLRKKRTSKRQRSHAGKVLAEAKNNKN